MGGWTEVGANFVIGNGNADGAGTVAPTAMDAMSAPTAGGTTGGMALAPSQSFNGPVQGGMDFMNGM